MAAIEISQWLASLPHKAAPVAMARAVAVIFGAVALVLWGLVVRDTVRHGVGGRDRSEIVIDVVMAMLVLCGPVLVVLQSAQRSDTAMIAHFLLQLRPVASAFGVATVVFWILSMLRMVADTAGLRAPSVDGVDLVAVVVAVAAPPLVAVEPILGDHRSQLWILLPLLLLAVVLPGMICAAGMLVARVSLLTGSLALWLVALVVVSTVDAWTQIAMVVSGYRLDEAWALVAACANFGFFLMIPLLERRRMFEGLDRLAPQRQIRRWDLIPAVVLVGAAVLIGQFVAEGGTASGSGIAVAVVLGVLMALSVTRHYAGVGEARRLYDKVQQMTSELYTQSHLDPLTGLFNRRALYERFSQLSASCARAGRPVSVAMVDLDHFKQFNDVHGHLAGDQALQRFAGRLRRVLRDEDLAVRFGGEEICVVAPGATPEQCAGLLERLRQAEHEAPPFPGLLSTGVLSGVVPLPMGFGTGRSRPRPEDSPMVTFSAGVALWRPGDDLDVVLKRADDACYQAKSSGRDRIVAAGTRDDGGGGPATAVPASALAAPGIDRPSSRPGPDTPSV